MGFPTRSPGVGRHVLEGLNHVWDVCGLGTGPGQGWDVGPHRRAWSGPGGPDLGTTALAHTCFCHICSHLPLPHSEPTGTPRRLIPPTPQTVALPAPPPDVAASSPRDQPPPPAGRLVGTGALVGAWPGGLTLSSRVPLSRVAPPQAAPEKQGPEGRRLGALGADPVRAQ